MDEYPLMRGAVVTLAVAVPYTVGGLSADRHVGLPAQLLLGVLTAAVLAGLLALQPRTVRVQTVALVGVATVGEIVGSLIWGLYSYRLDNLPAFVPPGHGVVFLCGVSLAVLTSRRPSLLLALAIAGAATWGIAGVTVLPAKDVWGAVGCGFLIAVLVVTRRPVYAGVFLAVAALEIYGTAIGTWTWEATVPGLGLSQGNPPSGAASGYVVFDVVALMLAARFGPGALRVVRREPRPGRQACRAEI
jgi:hypothetical protein